MTTNTNAALPDAVRVPLDSLHADAEYLCARLLDKSLTREEVVTAICSRIDAAKAALTTAAAVPAVRHIPVTDSIVTTQAAFEGGWNPCVDAQLAAAPKADRAMRAQAAPVAQKEPTAWAVYDIKYGGSKSLHWNEQHNPDGDRQRFRPVPLYEAPVAQGDGWLEAAVAWEVCASIHQQWAKGKDAVYSTRQADFQKHAEDARAKAKENTQ